MSIRHLLSLAILSAFVSTLVGCGPDTSTTVSGVDNSKIQTDEQMKEYEKQVQADMNAESGVIAK